MTVPGIGPIISSAMVAAIGRGEVFSKGRLAWPCCQADIDRRPHHPGQDIEAWQSLPARSVRAGGLGSSDPAEDLGAIRAQAWIEAAKKRLHRHVLAIALANKLVRIAWSVLAHDRNFEVRKIDEATAQSV
jgi:transposase